MPTEIVTYLPEIISISVISIFMAISPGADFVMITRNSICYSRRAGLYSALGISLAIWLHVAYSIAGLAILISKSILFFSVIKYLGAGYLIYIGWKTFKTDKLTAVNYLSNSGTLADFSAFKIGFITNALNPKTTLFFLSIFTQMVNVNTPLWIQIIYGAIISAAHLLWFSTVATLLSQPVLLKKFNTYKNSIEKVLGTVLIGFGLKIATISGS